ncbi:putative arginine N-methyltransferase 2 [Rosellinia necatrix]|uniref:Arginine N-methyltransferase 2 n=1 Tax=Rosellinia necatrix TaxID=77044 RepID=A0A1W2TGV9_ROSNE|nr:putative arginine N-methyltransferase 2 [Rosellinia necatrix]
MPDDTIEARIPASCPASISEILRHAWHHNLADLKPLLSVPGRASVQEPTTGETPLHAAIRSCGARTAAVNSGDATAKQPTDDDDDDTAAAAARAVVHELFLSGAIWNDVDSNDETPGCVAARLGQHELYNLCVGAGMRAELLFGLLDGYEQLESDAGEDEDEDEGEGEGEGKGKADGTAAAATEEGAVDRRGDAPEDIILESDPDRAFSPPQAAAGAAVTSAAYLRANLTYADGKLVDDAQNGVMMAWETSIMRSSVDALLPGRPAGRRVLNVGFGMGIIDAMFRDTCPSRHHIIEAHPEVLKHVESSPDCAFGKDWEASGPAEGAYKIHAGKWQEVVPRLVEQGEVYDAIYFDTFGEDYGQLRMFFTEHVLALLDDGGIFGFFNGLGADRKVCYDVYTKVVEMHLTDAGLDVEWNELDVDMEGLEEEGKGEWHGVKRRYWTLAKYRLPIITLMG